jgi:gas vesicle protein
MDNNDKRIVAGAFILGSLIGGGIAAVVALLFAPRSGEATREIIRARSGAMKANAEKQLSNALADVERSLDDLRKSISDQFESGKMQVKDRADGLRSGAKPGAVAGRIVEKVIDKK